MSFLAINHTLQNGTYRIESVLGKGGFGITYKAFWKTKVVGHLGAEIPVEVPVAIKELFPAVSGQQFCTRAANGDVVPQFDSQVFADHKRRFMEEAKTLGEFRKLKGVVHALGTFEEHNTAYLVMEFVDAPSLLEVVKQRGPLPEQEAIDIATYLLDALGALHAKGLLHRDVSPGNVLLPPDGNPVLIDFGIARAFEEDTFQTHTAFQTPGYTAPEQLAQRAKRGAYTDIYSLGCVLYFLLTGQRPQNANEVALEGYQGVRQHNPALSEAVDTCIARALSPRPVDRYASAAEMKAALLGHKIEVTPLFKSQQSWEMETQAATKAVSPKSKQKHHYKKYWLLGFLLLIVSFGGIFWFTNNRDGIDQNTSDGHLNENVMTGQEGNIGQLDTLKNLEKPDDTFSEKPLSPVKLAKDPFEGQMAYIIGGGFEMGQNDVDMFCEVCDKDEEPLHRVNLLSFYMSKYEVTQAQWREVMDTNPSKFKGCDDCPVENVSWNSVQAFLQKLNKTTGKKYRLPTEAEWECAASGGTNGMKNTYAGSENLDDVGWYDENADHKTHPVGQKNRNNLGLYDMSGNVAEWCSDWYDEKYYSNSPYSNPQGPASGTSRVLRGGSWTTGANRGRVTFRASNSPTYSDAHVGFRVVVSSL